MEANGREEINKNSCQAKKETKEKDRRKGVEDGKKSKRDQGYDGRD